MVTWRPVVLAAFLGLGVAPAFAQVSTLGDLVIVQDPQGALISGMAPQMTFCAGAFNAMRLALADQYDGIFAFTTYEGWTEMQNTWQGMPVRVAASGIGRGNTAGELISMPVTYDSQKLSQCVFMGTLGMVQGMFGLPPTEPLPADPDAPTKTMGVADGLTGLEMLGHEYGHHWLLGVEFDLGDGAGPRHFIRGFDEGEVNQHYSAYAGSGSVMYGDCITELGNGKYRAEGCPRKFNHIDQYLMGLRAPEEVDPMLLLDDGTGQGSAAGPQPIGSSTTYSGMTRYDVGADDLIRAMGPRVPAAGAAQRCWKVAFVVVLGPGQTQIPTAMQQKVEAYRSRFGAWFNAATDGRGMMETRLGFQCPVETGTDAGVETDGGAELDAGEDAGAADAGEGGPGCVGSACAEEAKDAGVSDETTKLRPGCGCSSGALPGVALLALLALLGRRRAVG